MTPQPAHVFTASLHATDGPATIEAPPRAALTVAAPPEFGGDPNSWSPEHLLLASIGGCFYATFRALAQRDTLSVHSFVCRVTGTVDKGPAGLTFSAIRLSVDVDVADAGQFALARSLLAKAERRCIVTQSLRIPVRIDSAVTTTPTSPETVAQVLR